MRLRLRSKSVLIILILLCGTSSFAQRSILYLKATPRASWKIFDKGLPAEATISGVAELGATLFITTDFHGIYKKGLTEPLWQKVGLGLPSNIDINAIEVLGKRLIIGTYRKGAWYSNDQGTSWFPCKTSFENNPIRALLNRGKDLLAGTDRGVYQSLDKGITWQHLSSDKQVLGFAIDTENAFVAMQDGAAVLDQEDSWKYIYKGDALHDIVYLNGAVYAFTLSSGLQMSFDLGKSWQKLQSTIGSDNLYTFEMSKYGNLTYAAQWKGVFASTNGGLTWFQDIGLPRTVAFGLLKKTSLGLLAAAAMR